eukprot:6199120-Pleurochrysis_carterae.AAC.3
MIDWYRMYDSHVELLTEEGGETSASCSVGVSSSPCKGLQAGGGENMRGMANRRKGTANRQLKGRRVWAVENAEKQ